MSYNVPDANPLGPGTMFWIDPVEMAPTPCVSSNGSVPVTLPYICTGKVAFTPNAGQTVYTNTGVSNPQLEALNSRFDQYPNSAKCDPATAPPDSNIKEYMSEDKTAGSPSKWMKTDPVNQGITFLNGEPKPWNTRTFADYGVLWSASRPTVAAGDSTDAAVSTRWTTFYHAGSGEATLYPQPSPYAQGTGSFFQAPSNTPKPGRRVLNIVIVDCKTAGGVCRNATVMGIGRFFMQRQANSPSHKDIYVEFAGLLPNPLPTSSIVLYR